MYRAPDYTGAYARLGQAAPDHAWTRRSTSGATALQVVKVPAGGRGVELHLLDGRLWTFWTFNSEAVLHACSSSVTP
jgi:hypothetical protein